LATLLLAQNKDEDAMAYAERAKARALLDDLQSGKVNVTKAMTPEEEQQERTLKYELASFNSQLSTAQRLKQPDEKLIAGLSDKVRQAQQRYESFQLSLYASHPELKVQRGETAPLNLAKAGELLADDKTALLSYIVAEEKTLLIVITKPARSSEAQLKIHFLPIKSATIAERVHAFRKKLAENKPGFWEESRDLYQTLLQKAQPQLRGVTRLVISPDGALWELPFQALVTEKRNYLWQDCAIAYAPSLTVLHEIIRSRRNHHTRSEPVTLLAVGDPSLGPEAISQYKTLMNNSLEQIPEAARQVKRLSRFYKQPKVYIGAKATEATVKAGAGQSSVLHLAAHGILNDRSPMYSHIVLAQNAADPKERDAGEAKKDGREEDGLLEAWEIMKMDLKADLVVLSACETARGRVSAGEGMIGLTWALFVAGAPTTVVSQWAVRSDSTARLMVGFHRRLRQLRRVKGNEASSPAKAESLRSAALELMNTQAYSHPFHWAGFVVVGDGFDWAIESGDLKAKSREKSRHPRRAVAAKR
jgi:CHAT domain-containing protein